MAMEAAEMIIQGVRCLPMRVHTPSGSKDWMVPVMQYFLTVVSLRRITLPGYWLEETVSSAQVPEFNGAL